MKNSTTPISLRTVVVFVVLAAAVVGVYFMSRLPRTEALSFAQRPEAVETGVVTVGSVAQQVLLAGEVEAAAEVALAPKVSGRLVRLAVGEGDRIGKGQLVAELDKDTLSALAEEARAAVDVAKANVASAVVTRENAKLEYDRAEALFEQGTSSQAGLDAAEATYKVAAAGVDIARAALSQAEAALEFARIQLREASIYAPFDAVVAEKLLDPGAFVAAGQPVMGLVSIDTVKITASVSERYLGDIEAGRTPVFITVDALPGKLIPGRLALVGPTVDTATRTARIDVLIENPQHVLKPGMYARVRLLTKEKPEATLMPNDSLLGREGGYYAYVVSEGGVRRKAVEVGLRGQKSVEVTAGLEPGDVVVTSGEGNLFDGAIVSSRGEAAR